MTHLTEREPIVHELKTWPQYFAAVRSGKKRFEIRRNDRDFRVGDTLRLIEYDFSTDTYSGAEHLALVDYLLPGGHFGLADDVVVMSLKDAVPSDPVSDEGVEKIIRELQHIRVGMLDHYQAAQILEKLVYKAQALAAPPSHLPAAGVEAAMAERDEAQEIARVFAERWPYGQSVAGDEALRIALCAVPPASGRIVSQIPPADPATAALDEEEAKYGAWKGDFAEALTMTGCTDLADLIDMANVGKSLMERIDQLTKAEGPFKNWTPADDPGEIVFDLANALDDALSDPPADPVRAALVEASAPIIAVTNALDGQYGFDDDKPVDARHHGEPYNDFPPLTYGDLRNFRAALQAEASDPVVREGNHAS